MKTEPFDIAAEQAGHEFTNKMVPRADSMNPYPLWHGWALRAAFVAGAKWQAAGRKRIPAPEASKEEA